MAVGPVMKRKNGLGEITEKRKVESRQVKSCGGGGLLSCAVFFSAPHPCYQSLGYLSISPISTLSLACIILSLSYLHRWEDSSPIGVGGGPESQVCLAGGRSFACGLGMDGDLIAGTQPVFCLERQSANTLMWKKWRNPVNEWFKVHSSSWAWNIKGRDAI